MGSRHYIPWNSYDMLLRAITKPLALQQQFLIDGTGDVGQHASPNHFVPLRLIELGGSWIVGLIEGAEKAIRRD
jgi:hypothetical protein